MMSELICCAAMDNTPAEKMKNAAAERFLLRVVFMVVSLGGRFFLLIDIEMWDLCPADSGHIGNRIVLLKKTTISRVADAAPESCCGKTVKSNRYR
jgi:hypothetical protein